MTGKKIIASLLCLLGLALACWCTLEIWGSARFGFFIKVLLMGLCAVVMCATVFVYFSYRNELNAVTPRRPARRPVPTPEKAPAQPPAPREKPVAETAPAPAAEGPQDSKSSWVSAEDKGPAPVPPAPAVQPPRAEKAAPSRPDAVPPPADKPVARVGHVPDAPPAQKRVYRRAEAQTPGQTSMIADVPAPQTPAPAKKTRAKAPAVKTAETGKLGETAWQRTTETVERPDGTKFDTQTFTIDLEAHKRK